MSVVMLIIFAGCSAGVLIGILIDNIGEVYDLLSY